MQGGSIYPHHQAALRHNMIMCRELLHYDFLRQDGRDIHPLSSPRDNGYLQSTESDQLLRAEGHRSTWAGEHFCQIATRRRGRHQWEQ